jgi:hypothetical protein
MNRGSLEAIVASRMALRYNKTILWRERAWGYVSLTPREYEAVVRERAVRFAERGIDDTHLQRIEDELTVAFRVGNHDRRREARTAMNAELGKLHKVERGIQTQVAREMGISRQSVSELLQRASFVMAYFAECRSDADYGWRCGIDRVWWLAVPIAPIDPYTRRKHQNEKAKGYP